MSPRRATDPEELHVLVDARWLGDAGSGRVTQHLLMGLHELGPPGRWSIWASPEAEQFLWPGAALVASRHHPHQWYSQREFPGPRSLHADVAFYTHQLRPGWRLARREITTVYDTIPVRHPTVPRMARPMTAFVRHMARISDVVATFSEHSRRTIAKDLRTGTKPVVRLPMPIDLASAGRVRALRESTERSCSVVYIGADFPHKNLDRLIAAFGATAFHADGGTLTLVGTDDVGARRLRESADRVGVRVDIPGRVSQERLEATLAAADALVQPSLEEGFGLPVAEAMAAGIPVAVSAAGSLPEVTLGLVPLFDPTDVAAMARAIDDAVVRVDQPIPARPSQLDLAHAVHDLVLTASRMSNRSRSRR